MTRNSDVSGTKPEEHAAPAAPATTAGKPKNRIHSFHLNDLWCNVFAFQRKNGSTYYCVTIARSYKNAVGDWKSTQFLSLDDLAVAIELANQAREYIKSLSDPAPELLLEQAE